MQHGQPANRKLMMQIKIFDSASGTGFYKCKGSLRLHGESMTITRLEDDTAYKCQIHSNGSVILQQHIMTDIVKINMATVFRLK